MAAHDSKARTQQPLVASATHSTDIQVPPSGSTTGIRLAPTSKPIPARPPATPAKLRFSPERLASEIARLDKGLAAILLLLAFLLASAGMRQ